MRACVCVCRERERERERERVRDREIEREREREIARLGKRYHEKNLETELQPRPRKSHQDRKL